MSKRKAAKAAPSKPRRKTDNQIFIRTTTEVVAAVQVLADQEERPLSKAAERLLIEILRKKGLLAQPTIGVAAPPLHPAQDRVRGGADGP